jgi:hypothetical protein
LFAGVLLASASNAGAETYGLYNDNMAATRFNVGHCGCGIVRTSGSAGYTYSALSG